MDRSVGYQLGVRGWLGGEGEEGERRGRGAGGLECWVLSWEWGDGLAGVDQAMPGVAY